MGTAEGADLGDERKNESAAARRRSPTSPMRPSTQNGTHEPVRTRRADHTRVRRRRPEPSPYSVRQHRPRFELTLTDTTRAALQSASDCATSARVTTAPRALPELDALRAVALAAVVALHVSFGVLLAAPPGTVTATAVLAAHLLAGYGAPLFVALSMAGLALGYERPPRALADYGAFLARRARRILPAYVFWTLVTMVRNEPAALLQPAVLGERLATGNAAYHLYFVPLICMYYLAWPLLAPLAAAAQRSPLAAAGIAGGGLAGSLVVWHAASLGNIAAGLATLPLFWLGFAAVGLASAPIVARRAAAPPWRPMAALTVVTAIVMIRHVRELLGPAPADAHIAIAVTIFQIPSLAYVLAAMAFATALVLRSRNGGAALAAFGRRAYGVYLVHVLIHEVVVRRIVGATTAAAAGSPTWAVAMIAEWAATLALAFALVWSMERVPVLAPLAGVRPPSR